MTSCKKNYKISDRIIRNCARFIYNKLPYESVSQCITDDLKWLFSNYMYQFEVLKIARKITWGIVPAYFKDYLCLNTISVRETRNHNYMRPNMNYNSTMGVKSFRYIASKMWSDLPTNIVEANSFKAFKNLLYAHLSNEQNEYLADNHTLTCNLSCIDAVIDRIRREVSLPDDDNELLNL